MKLLIYFSISIALVLSSCSSGRLASGNFSKRKYTKGVYKSKRDHYTLAKGEKVKKEDHNKTPKKSVREKKNKREEQLVQKSEELLPSDPNEIAYDEKAQLDDAKLQQDEIEVQNKPKINYKEIRQQIEADYAVNSPTSPTPGISAGLIISFVALAIAITAAVFAAIGFMSIIYAWIGLAGGGLAIILGSIGHAVDRNVASGFAIALGVLAVLAALVFVILFFAGVL